MKTSPPTPTSPPPAGFQAWWMLAILSLFCALSYLDRYILTMLVDPIQEDLGVSDFMMGIVLGPAFGITIALCGLPLGWAVDRYPRRWIVFLAVTFWSMATASIGLVTSTWGLISTRMGVAVGEASLGPAAVSLLADRFPPNRLTIATAIYQSGLKVGSALAFAIGGLVIGLTSSMQFSVPWLGTVASWQIVLLAIGAPGILLAFLTLTFQEPRRFGRSTQQPVYFGAIFRYLAENWKLFLPMLLGFSLISISGFSLVAWVPTYISRQFNWDPQHYGPALGLISLLSAAGLILKGWVIDLLYTRGVKDAHLRFYSWVLIGSLPISLSVFFVPNAFLFILMYGFVSVVTIPSILYLTATLPLIAPNELRGQLASVIGLLYSLIGMGIGPTLVGSLTSFVFHDESKLGYSLACVLGTSLPAAIILLRISLPQVRHRIESRESLANA